MTTSVRRAPQFHLGDRALEAKRQIEKQRYSLPERPEGPMPPIPPDITELGDRALVNLMTDLTRWAEHLGVQLAMAEVDERWAEAAMEKQRAYRQHVNAYVGVRDSLPEAVRQHQEDDAAGRVEFGAAIRALLALWHERPHKPAGEYEQAYNHIYAVLATPSAQAVPE